IGARLRRSGSPAAVTAAAAAAAAAATAAAAAALALLGLVDAERTAVHHRAVGLGNRLLRFRVRSHRDEREAARAAGLTIHDDVHVGHRAAARKRVADAVGGRVEGQIAYVKSVSHDLSRSTDGAVSKSAFRP